jgi:hypothetical protein
MKQLKTMFIDSFKGSTGKVDHKRLTAFVFVILVITIGLTALFGPILSNIEIIKAVLEIAGIVIVGVFVTTKIDFRKNKKEETENADQ